MFVIKNAVVLNDRFQFTAADVAVDGKKIVQVAPQNTLDLARDKLLTRLVRICCRGS